MNERRILSALFGVLLFCLGDAPSSARDARLEALEPRHRDWLEEVAPLISKQEREAFLALEHVYQRDGFIEAFWKARDPDPRTEVNEYRDGYYARRREVLARYGNDVEDRAVVFLTNGEPASISDYEEGCTLLLWPIEIWRYRSSLKVNRAHTLIFYSPGFSGYRLWHPEDGFGALASFPACSEEFDSKCNRNLSEFALILRAKCRIDEQVDDIVYGLTEVVARGTPGILAALAQPVPPDAEWLSGFRSFSTDLPVAAEELPASLELSFLGQHQSRTVVRGDLVVPAAEARAVTLGDSASHAFELNGEVLRDGALFESFRYRFEQPPPAPEQAELALSFERFLRPGDYELVVRLEEIGSGRFFRVRRPLAVPRPEENEAVASTAPAVPDARHARHAQDARRARVRILAPAAAPLVGPVRFEARVTGDGIRRVQFLLDERPVLTKMRPPFSVELNLGSLPRGHALRVVALGADGAELASDELLVNPGEHLFAVRLVEPRRGRTVEGEIWARAEVKVPEGARVERVELFLGERRLVTMYQEPWSQRVVVPPGEELEFLRAVATLADGRVAEDLVVVRGSPFREEIEVRTVELYTTVVDAAGRPVTGLGADEFVVREDGRPQRLVRFAEVRDLPLHAAILIDSSASMADSLDAVRDAAYGFLEQALAPGDRAAVITFSNEPRLASPFTANLELLAGGLAGLKPEQSTALYDSLVFALHYFGGIQGQRALVVLSDGRDQRSRYAFEEALEFARRSGVTIYSVGLSLAATNLAGRHRLDRLAAETGGRSLFTGDAAALAAWYASISAELRARYLLVYQSEGAAEGDDYRRIEVSLRRAGLEARTVSGYFP